MEAVILVIHLIVAVGIIITILLQPSEAGGFVGNSGSMSNLMSQRRSGNVLTRATTILAIIFFLTSIILAIIAGRQPEKQSILELGGAAPGIEKAVEVAPTPAEPEAPIGGDSMKKNKKAEAPVPSNDDGDGDATPEAPISK